MTWGSWWQLIYGVVFLTIVCWLHRREGKFALIVWVLGIAAMITVFIIS